MYMVAFGWINVDEEENPTFERAFPMNEKIRGLKKGGRRPNRAHIYSSSRTTCKPTRDEMDCLDKQIQYSLHPMVREITFQNADTRKQFKGERYDVR